MPSLNFAIYNHIKWCIYYKSYLQVVISIMHVKNISRCQTQCGAVLHYSHCVYGRQLWPVVFHARCSGSFSWRWESRVAEQDHPADVAVRRLLHGRSSAQESRAVCTTKLAKIVDAVSFRKHRYWRHCKWMYVRVVWNILRFITTHKILLLLKRLYVNAV